MTAVGAAGSKAAARIYRDTKVYGDITPSSYRFRVMRYFAATYW